MSQQVIAAVADLFFASKIRTTAEGVGAEVSFVRNAEVLMSAVRKNKPDLVIVDLQATNIDPMDIAKRLRADEALREIPLLGFYSHILTELQDQAREAGYTHIMPRSAFSQKLAAILKGKS